MQELSLVTKDTLPPHEITSFDNHFRDKYIGDEAFDYRKKTGNISFVQKLKRMIERFIQTLFGWDKEHKVGNITDISLKILSILLVLFVIYLLVRLILSHNGRWFSQRKNENIEIDINDTEQLVRYADFENMIDKSEKTGNTRQSIRLYYLWLLRTFDEKKIIEWNLQKTNADYRKEIKDETILKNFTYLSYLYNYIWYGEFSITDTDYLTAKKVFLNHLRTNGDNHG